jgi:hypothetical protein
VAFTKQKFKISSLFRYKSLKERRDFQVRLKKHF